MAKRRAAAVSVVLPVRNGAQFVGQAIASIGRQTFEDFELVIVDDGSEDATPAILARAAAADRRIRVMTQPPLGLVASLNRAIADASAELIARMDADDVAAPERLGRQTAALAAHPGTAAIGSAWRIIDGAGTPLGVIRPPISPAAIRARLQTANCMAHPTVLMRRQAVLAAGGYRAFPMCEDYDLWLRLSERHDLRNLGEPLLDYRRHPGQCTWHGLEQRILSELAALAAARCRRSGLADPADGIDLPTADFLLGLGMTQACLRSEITGRALGAARDAMAAGNRTAAEAALTLARRQGGARLRTRLGRLLLRGRTLLMPR
ncbi:MAG: glycosyltransferase [Acidisphaera sp.]|nr:glycosyltransferase [Acidisphaera sp.]